MKIAIIGMPGSGKSALGFKLHEILGIPLYYLDQFFWEPGWQRPDRAAFEKIHNQLCDQKEWIIEGCALRLFEYRIMHADIVIFLDIPMCVCLYRVFKRAFLDFGKVRFSSAKGCPEGVPSFTFLQYIWNFNIQRRPRILELLETYRNKKKIFIVRSKVSLGELVQTFESNTL